VRDERVELAERARVREQLDALPRRQLTLRVLRPHALEAAASDHSRARSI
jgi:hypothetical protein